MKLNLPAASLCWALTAPLALCLGHADAAPKPGLERKPQATAVVPAGALQKIDAADMLEHITALASDEFEGRAPGSHGEQVTVDYLQQQFKRIGLAPGNPDGTYLQPVPLVAVSSHPRISYIAGHSEGEAATELAYGDDFMAWTLRAEKKVAIPSSELVFVGYGVTAPQFNWDDYKGVDLRGKTLLMLINDPPLPDPKHPKQLDKAMFGGAALSYYGRWNYKFEQAARLGAAAALIIHDTKPAGYPFEVVKNTWGRENFTVLGKPDASFPAVAGWLQQDSARAIVKAGGQDLDALKKAALSRDFKPVALNATVQLVSQNTWRQVASNNVVGRIAGSDPALKDETIVYTAHWDHFGIDEQLPGPRSQQVFHGARDNASGVAALLEVARAYKALPVAPRRSIVFVLTTGQEKGLLGAQYYVRHPLYPLKKTLLAINLDSMNVWGRTRDVELSGMGRSGADALVTRVAKSQGRVVRPDPDLAGDSFYRGDQFEFARAGVPVVQLRSGVDFIGKPAGFGRDKLLGYTAHQYHTVNDVVQPGWNLEGAVQDAALLFQVGYQAAQADARPQWNDDAEFKAARDGAGKTTQEKP